MQEFTTAVEEELPEVAGLVIDMVGDAIEEMPHEDPLVPQIVIESMTLELPVELYVRGTAEGAMRIVSSPPRQKVETTIMPVWHQLKIRVVEDHAG